MASATDTLAGSPHRHSLSHPLRSTALSVFLSIEMARALVVGVDGAGRTVALSTMLIST